MADVGKASVIVSGPVSLTAILQLLRNEKTDQEDAILRGMLDEPVDAHPVSHRLLMCDVLWDCCF